MPLQLTKAQAKAIEWAISPMQDIALDPHMSQDFGYGEAHLPKLEGNTLDISECNQDAIADLLYRIEEQLPDMAHDEGKWATIGMCGRLSVRIRKATGFEGPTF